MDINCINFTANLKTNKTNKNKLTSIKQQQQEENLETGKKYSLVLKQLLGKIRKHSRVCLVAVK